MWTPCNASIQRSRVQHVTLDDLGAGLHTGPHLLRAAGQAAEPHALLFQQRDQPTADVAAAAGEQDQGPVFVVHVRHRSIIPRNEILRVVHFTALPVLQIAGGRSDGCPEEGSMLFLRKPTAAAIQAFLAEQGQARSDLLGGGGNGHDPACRVRRGPHPDQAR